MIPQYIRLDTIRDFKKEGYYIVTTNELNKKLDKLDRDYNIKTPTLPRSAKVAGIIKLSKVCKRVLSNEIYIYTKNPAFISQIERIVIEF
jgi:hypothetical protein